MSNLNVDLVKKEEKERTVTYKFIPSIKNGRKTKYKCRFCIRKGKKVKYKYGYIIHG